MQKCFGWIFAILVSGQAVANDCLKFKKNPAVFVNLPDWEKVVVQPKTPMDFWHGNVVATLVDNYDFVADVNPVDDGFCVGLKTVEALVGYSEFIVQIDMRHVPKSCSYNAVLKHEDKHIESYLSVIDDFKPDLQQSMFVAADSVMPVFVKSKDDVDAVIDLFNMEFQKHPEIILLKQKIKAAQEIRNKQIDQNESGAELDKCF